MKSRLLLDVVVGKSTSILKLLPSKDQTLLIRRNSLLVLDLSLNVVNRIRWLDIKGDGLSSESLDENLLTYKMCEIMMNLLYVSFNY